jgi:hypothetical protein
MYFFFTTLTSVGFGDIYPNIDFERLIFVVILICGVAFFSILVDKLKNILIKLK